MPASYHGEKRIRERSGLSKKAIDRSLGRVLFLGKSKEFYEYKDKRLFNYLKRVEADNVRRDKNIRLLVYGNSLYIFGDKETLITTWVLPTKYRGGKKPPKEYEYAVEELVTEDA